MPHFASPSSFIRKFVNGLEWCRRWTRDWIKGWLSRRGPGVYIHCHSPWPMKKPWQRSHLRLSAPGGGIGDELMCTAIFAEIKKRNPHCHLTFITRYPEYFAPHPLIDAVEVESKPPQRDVIRLAYHYTIPPSRPLMTLMGECVGLHVEVDQLIPPPIVTPGAIAAELALIPGPRVVIQPLSSRWTTNKNWPASHWRELIGRLGEHYSVVEVGTEPLFADASPSREFWSFAGRTSVSELAFIISRADLFIGPSSGGMHLANAYRVPSIIIFGGYESPEGYGYPRSKIFQTSAPCSPCWRQTCPYDVKCLTVISPNSVHEAAFQLVPPPR